MTTVLLHGLGADRRQPLELFTPVVRAVHGAGELVVAPDVRAHGGFLTVGEPADFELHRLAAEVADAVRSAVAEETGSEVEASGPLTIVGISMGAALALHLALDELLPVTRTVFVRPSFSGEPLPDNLRPFPVIGQILADAGPGGASEFRERSVFRHVAAISPAGARGLLAQFTAPDAAQPRVRDRGRARGTRRPGHPLARHRSAARPGASARPRRTLGGVARRTPRGAARPRRRAAGADGGAPRPARAVARVLSRLGRCR